MGVLAELHNAHKERQARIEAAAYKPVLVVDHTPEAKPVPVVVVPPVFCKPILDAATEQPRYDWSFWYEVMEGSPTKRRPSIKTIQSLVCSEYSVSMTDLLSQRRPSKIVRPRQIAMYLCKILTLRSLPELGRHFGGRDHTTVLHAVQKMQRLHETDENDKAEIDALIALLGGIDGR